MRSSGAPVSCAAGYPRRSAPRRPLNARVRTQMIAVRGTRRIKVLAVIAGGFAVVVALLAAVFPRDQVPFRDSLIYWAWLLPLSVLAYAALEMLGTWFASRPFLSRLPSSARIFVTVAFAVLVILVIVTASKIVDADAF